MKLLNHLDPSDIELLAKINNNWPIQFLSEYTRFHNYFFNESIKIAFDEETGSYMPIRFFNAKIISPAQIVFAPFRDAIELDATEQLHFFNKLLKMLNQQGGCDRLVQPHPLGMLSAYPNNAKYCEFGTYIVDLENQTEEQIFEKFHPKYQKAVQHSLKNNACVRIGKENLNDFYYLYESTMKHSGLFNDELAFFNTIINYLGESRVACGVVYDQNKPISGILLLYTNYGAFLTHAGTWGDSKLYGAAKLLNFEMMKYLKGQGVKIYDFVGVRINNDNDALAGIFRFKKGFGGELKTGYLWKTDISKLKTSAYDLLIKLIPGKKNIVDIIDQINK